MTVYQNAVNRSDTQTTGFLSHVSDFVLGFIPKRCAFLGATVDSSLSAASNAGKTAAKVGNLFLQFALAFAKITDRIASALGAPKGTQDIQFNFTESGNEILGKLQKFLTDLFQVGNSLIGVFAPAAAVGIQKQMTAWTAPATKTSVTASVTEAPVASTT